MDHPPARPSAPSPSSPPKRGRPPASARTHDADHTSQDILAVATREFADKGLSGARIDEIAASTHTSKRMIYYYFGSKEGLYIAVLENAYARMQEVEGELDLDDVAPMDGLRRLVEFTFDYQVSHPDFVRLMMNENIHNGAFLAQSDVSKTLHTPAMARLNRLYERGCAEGVFRKGIDPVDLHMSISALCFSTVSKRHTFSLIFKRDMASPAVLSARRSSIVDMVTRYVRA